jgi:hypothetical protein
VRGAEHALSISATSLDPDEQDDALAGLAAFSGRIDAWRFDGHGIALVRAGVRRTYRRARRGARACRGVDDADAFHEWRKDAKHHVHHLRLLRAAWPPVLDVRAAETSRLCDLLGGDHDLADLERTLLRADDGPPRWVARLRKAMRAETAKARVAARALGDRLFAERSAAFVARLEAYLGACEAVGGG